VVQQEIVAEVREIVAKQQVIAVRQHPAILIEQEIAAEGEEVVAPA
jgi:hypothetical protein